MSVHRIFTLLHKWITLIIGIQIVLWIAGGLVMSFFDIDRVRGSHNVREGEPQRLTGSQNLVSPSQALAQNDLSATRMTTRFMLGKPVYEISSEDGTAVLDATTGEKLTPIDEQTARALAMQDFAPEAEIISIELLQEAGYEYRGGPLPVWQVVFNDKEDTRLYISANHGRVTARRNEVWRIFDFFWMLHIMDYKDRDNFNSWLLIIASLIALFGVMSGVGLYFYRFRRRDFSWVLPKK